MKTAITPCFLCNEAFRSDGRILCPNCLYPKQAVATTDIKKGEIGWFAFLPEIAEKGENMQETVHTEETDAGAARTLPEGPYEQLAKMEKMYLFAHDFTGAFAYWLVVLGEELLDAYPEWYDQIPPTLKEFSTYIRDYMRKHPSKLIKSDDYVEMSGLEVLDLITEKTLGALPAVRD